MTSKIIYDAQLMKVMSFFESRTRAKLKDCLTLKDFIIFVVQPGQIGKAIGKKGSNVRMLEYSLKKRIKIVEFSDDAAVFISNLIYPLKAKDIKQQGSTVIIYCDDVKTKGLLIGRSSQNLRNTEKIVGRYFGVEHIRVE